MHAWQCQELSGPSGLSWNELPDPVPGRRQVLVQIEAAGLNFLDTLITEGRYQVKPPLPFIPGVEYCGRVVAAGPDATMAIGTRVAGTAQGGAFATHTLADERVLVPVPDFIPAHILAAVPIVYPTAYLALHELAALKPGETVLVTAAAGGVGLAAVQLARVHGARVIGAAAASKHALLADHGCALTVDYADPAWAEAVKTDCRARGREGVDVVVEMVGGSVAVTALKLLGWRGRLLTVGYASGEIPQLPANLLLLKQARAEGVYWGGAVERDPKLAMRVAAQLFALMSDHGLTPHVSEVRPMAELPALLTRMAARQTVGKLVVVNA